MYCRSAEVEDGEEPEEDAVAVMMMMMKANGSSELSIVIDCTDRPPMSTHPQQQEREGETLRWPSIAS